jgi:hypothetical protein
LRPIKSIIGATDICLAFGRLVDIGYIAQVRIAEANMRKLTTVHVVVVAVAALAPLLAMQESKLERTKESPTTKFMMQPEPEIQRLIAMFAGTWATEEKHEPSPWMPKGGTGRGTEKFRGGPGGLSLIAEYRSKNPNGAYEGHGIIFWDPRSQVYRSVWCDSVTPAGCSTGGVGKWEGDNLVFTEKDDLDEETFENRQTYSDIKPGSFTFTMESASVGKRLKPVMTIRYKKIGRPNKK